MTRVIPDFINASPDVLALLEAASKADARAAIEAVGKPASSLAKRLAVFSDTTGGLLAEASGLTLAQQGQARADIGAGVLGGFRNKIINGDFEIAQRGTGPFVGGIYGIDRWRGGTAGSSLSTTRQTFTVGQTDVPGNPLGFARCAVTSVAGAGNIALYIQFIEGVHTLAGRQATLTFWAKADAPKNMTAELTQHFGTSGSAEVQAIDPQKVALTTAWQKFSLVFNVPSIVGKVVGTGDKLQINLWFDAGSNYNARTASLGQQSGTFDIAHVSLVEGDARAETDPFSPRHIQQEWDLCLRYFEAPDPVNTCLVRYASIYAHSSDISFQVKKRVTPTVAVTVISSQWSDTSSSPVLYSVQATNSSICPILSLTGGAAGGVGQMRFSYVADAEL